MDYQPSLMNYNNFNAGFNYYNPNLYNSNNNFIQNINPNYNFNRNFNTSNFVQPIYSPMVFLPRQECVIIPLYKQTPNYFNLQHSYNSSFQNNGINYIPNQITINGGLNFSQKNQN